MFKNFLQTTFIIFSLAAPLVAADDPLRDEAAGYILGQPYRFDIQTSPRCRWQPYAVVRFCDPETLEIDLDAFKVQELPLLKRIGYNLTGLLSENDLRGDLIFNSQTIWRALAALSGCVISLGFEPYGAISLGLDIFETSFINSQTLNLVDDNIEADDALKARIRASFLQRFPMVRTILPYGRSSQIVIGNLGEFANE